MHEYALADNLPYFDASEDSIDIEQFYCVEVPVKPGLIYQFKIRRTETFFMSILVKKESAFLTMVNINSKFKMKYFSRDFLYPYEELVTEVRDISLQKCGRYKDHYLVSLKIIESPENNKLNRLFYAGDYSRLAV